MSIIAVHELFFVQSGAAGSKPIILHFMEEQQTYSWETFHLISILLTHDLDTNLYYFTIHIYIFISVDFSNTNY